MASDPPCPGALGKADTRTPGHAGSDAQRHAAMRYFRQRGRCTADTGRRSIRDLFQSARRLKSLPDYVEVLPGAYAGSVCGRRLSGKPWSTIGFEKRHNEAFRIMDEAAFIRFMLAEIPPAPPEAAALRAANSGATAAAA